MTLRITLAEFQNAYEWDLIKDDYYFEESAEEDGESVITATRSCLKCGGSITIFPTLEPGRMGQSEASAVYESLLNSIGDECLCDISEEGE